MTRHYGAVLCSSKIKLLLAKHEICIFKACEKGQKCYVLQKQYKRSNFGGYAYEYFMLIFFSRFVNGNETNASK